MQTIVINNKEGLIIGQLPHNGKGTDGAPLLGGTIILIPGVNLVDSKKLADLRKSEGFEVLFKTRIERSLAPEQNPESVGKNILVIGQEVADKSPLAKLSDKACEALIEETLTESLLVSWLAEENRADVRRAIDAQIKILNTGVAASTIAAGR